MAIITVQVDNQSSFFNNSIIYTNATIMKKLNLPVNKQIQLTFGNRQTTVIPRVSTYKGNLLIIPASIANYLLLPNGIQIHAKYDKEETCLVLGPLLGIIVQSIQSNSKTPFGKFTPYVAELSNIARTNGVIPYLFTIDHINRKNESVNGWMLKGTKWEKLTFPIPDVIYNRITSRKAEQKALPIIKELNKRYGFIFFNDHFLNKWDVYQMLKPTKIRNLLPTTIVYKSSNTIKEMLNKYPVIFLKPPNGSLGIGIIRVQKQHNKYIIRHSRMQGPITLTFDSFGLLMKYLIPRLHKKNYLVQQGLDLITIGNRPVDFRILVQKGKQGNWSIASMVSRIANDNNFVSNLAQGGTQSKVIETIKNANPELIKKVTKKHFRNYSLRIAKHIEAESDGLFAELGIDLALDKKGRVWLLEVNSKPSKIDDQRENNEPRPSVIKLIHYVLYITKKKRKMNNEIAIKG